MKSRARTRTPFGTKQEHEVFFIPALSGDGNDGDAGKVINQGSVGAVMSCPGVVIIVMSFVL